MVAALLAFFISSLPPNSSSADMIAKFFFLARSLLCWRALHSNDGRFDLCVCGLAYRMSAYECISSKSFDMMATIAK